MQLRYLSARKCDTVTKVVAKCRGVAGGETGNFTSQCQAMACGQRGASLLAVSA